MFDQIKYNFLDEDYKDVDADAEDDHDSGKHDDDKYTDDPSSQNYKTDGGVGLHSHISHQTCIFSTNNKTSDKIRVVSHFCCQSLSCCIVLIYLKT